MTDHVYKLLELTGSSPSSIEDAIRNAIARAAKTIRNMHWFEVTETRGHIVGAKVAHWQVTLKVGFTLEDVAEDEGPPARRARRRKSGS
jgi:flavin-binding protein dodecin